MKGLCLRCGEFARLCRKDRFSAPGYSWTEHLQICRRCFDGLAVNYGTAKIEEHVRRLSDEKTKAFDEGLRPAPANPRGPA